MTHPPGSGLKTSESDTQHTYVLRSFWLSVPTLQPPNHIQWNVRANSSVLAGSGSIGHWGLFFLSACTRRASGHCVCVLTGGHPRIYWEQTEAVCALGASLHLGLLSRHHSRTCSKSARIQSCDSHARAAHIHHRQWTHFIPRVINTASSHGKLTQNMRLKANIKCLMHVSPPDSAAMVVLMVFRTWSSRTATEDLQQISPGRMRLFVDAPAMLRASCCARLLWPALPHNGMQKQSFILWVPLLSA